MNPADIAVVLHQYGGWGLSSVLFVALVCLYNRNSKTLDDRHAEFVSILREVSGAMAASREAIERCNSLLTRIEGKL